MNESRDFTTEGLEGLKPLSQSNYIEWRDVVDDYLDSQNWVKYSVEGLPANANDELRAKSAKIAVFFKDCCWNAEDISARAKNTKRHSCKISGSQWRIK